MKRTTPLKRTGFAKPDYATLLAKQIARRKPGSMEMDYAKPGQLPMLCKVCGALYYVNPGRVGRSKTCLLHRGRQKAKRTLRARRVSKAKTVDGAGERAIRDECDELTRRIILPGICCFVCGRFNVELHPGHYITRKVLALRWDTKRNLRPQCNDCNAYHNEHPHLYRRLLVIDIGESEVRDVERIAKLNLRLEYSDLIEIRDGLRREMASLLTRKGLKAA